MTVVYAVIAFGVLIFVHELGHLLAAKAVKIRVNDFSIGMGPRLCGFKMGETSYSLRLFPIGGSCSMDEDESSDDPRSFNNRPRLARLLVLVAGSAMNLLLGVIILFCLIAPSGAVTDGVISAFPPEIEGSNGGLEVGDRIISINGERVYVAGSDVSMLLSRYSAPYDIVVERKGEKMKIDADLKLGQYTDQSGEKYTGYGIMLSVRELDFWGKLEYTLRYSANYVRMIRFSLVDLFSGKVGADQLSGPVGITATISQAADQKQFGVFFNLVGFIAINLAVMNLLPLPALDGGRVLFLAIEAVMALFGRKRLDPKYENYIHLAGLGLLLLLMVFVTYNDIVRLIS